MKKAVIGILAHVDAGKTTLSEGMLYESGMIREKGRVDAKNAFLDTYELERARGITIFSKQAMIRLPNMEITLLDTPGHVDFSAEMERTLQVLDYAILVISGMDGVQGHTQTLWRLLMEYRIPTLLFVNKMDQAGADKATVFLELKEKLSENIIDFTEPETENFYEATAMCEEQALELYLEKGKLPRELITDLIAGRKLFPCFFGSALLLSGVSTFLEGLADYTTDTKYPEVFGARVFKIARDEKGNRLTYLKVTGGVLNVRMPLNNTNTELGQAWEEKVTQIRLYSGEKYESIETAKAGTVCAVTGLSHTQAGEGLGFECEKVMPILEPVLTYKIQLPEACDVRVMLPKLQQLEEEIPELHIIWDEQLQELQAQIMGEVQIEILKSMIWERFGVKVEFGAGAVVYKETITNVVEGIGHFEPLRHYAEVHLKLEPAEPGSGMQFESDCSEDMLGKNWQRLIITHLEEKEHKGILTGAAITDIKITVIAGKAHIKHTEGGDFRQATYRAVRQGLMQADVVLLEPYYRFRLDLPGKMLGRAMTDMERLYGKVTAPEQNGERAVLAGIAPVATLREYQREVIAYTKGEGSLSCTLQGYFPCHNTEEVKAQIAYDAEQDTLNPSGSVFCAHGAGFIVPWDKVPEYIHVERVLVSKEKKDVYETLRKRTVEPAYHNIGTEEVDQILNRTFYANRRERTRKYHHMPPVPEKRMTYTATYDKKETYLLVDGYNIIFAWQELKELAEVDIHAARGRLMDILCNYQGIRKCNLILVFDAYRVQGHEVTQMSYHNIQVVFTKEAETADQYIEKFAHENGRKYQVTVATSDGLEQIIIRGQGCRLLSARELWVEVNQENQAVMAAYKETQQSEKRYLLDEFKVENLKESTKNDSQIEE